jgi:SAM-dependent methyltransferase
MDLRTVRDAYSAASREYIDLFDGDWDAHEVDAAFILRQLRAAPGPVLDLGCGPGYWSAYLHEQGLDVTGVDLVPEFIEHARAHHPGPAFRLGSMADVAGAGSVAGILSWFSTIHLSPSQLDPVLAHYRRLLGPSGTLVLGFFASADEVSEFDHAVMTAYRWPAAAMAERLVRAGFVEVERLERQVAERPDRRFGALAARVL